VPLVLLLLALLDRPFDFHTAAADPDVLGMLQDLAVRGSSKVDDLEVAAFIVKGPDGAVRCLMWPHTANRRAEEYHGSVPEGTVAIAHTHPLFAELPSRGDVEQSKRIGLPIYVITRWHLYAVDPASGERVQLIRQKNWTRTASKRCHCQDAWLPQPAEARGQGNRGSNSH